MISVSMIVALTIAGCVIVGALIGLLAFIMRMQWNRQHFIDVCLRTKTGGKPQVDLVKCKIYRSKKSGSFLYNDRRRIVIPRFDQDSFLPRRASGRMFLDVTASDGYFYANNMRPLDQLLRRDIYVTDENGDKKATKGEIEDFLRTKYQRVDYNDWGGMVNQIPHVDRAQALQNDDILAQLNKEKGNFWLSKEFMFISTVAMGVILAIVIVVLAIKHAEFITGGAKPAGGFIVDAAKFVGGNVSMPPTP